MAVNNCHPIAPGDIDKGENRHRIIGDGLKFKALLAMKLLPPREFSWQDSRCRSAKGTSKQTIPSPRSLRR